MTLIGLLAIYIINYPILSIMSFHDINISFVYQYHIFFIDFCNILSCSKVYHNMFMVISPEIFKGYKKKQHLKLHGICKLFRNGMQMKLIALVQKQQKNYYSCLPVEHTRLQQNSRSNALSMMFVWFTLTSIMKKKTLRTKWMQRNYIQNVIISGRFRSKI